MIKKRLLGAFSIIMKPCVYVQHRVSLVFIESVEQEMK